MHEALWLSAGARQLSFTAIVDGAGPASDRLAPLAERRARRALDRALALAAAGGIAAESDVVCDNTRDVPSALLARAGRRDLLIAGTHDNARLAGIATGSVATALAHRATGPLLVARRRPPGSGPRHILVAVDDSPAALGIVRLAAAIAATCGGYVHLAHVRGADYGSQTRHLLAELSVEIIAVTGAEPIVDVLGGPHPAARVADLAQRSQANLVVMGRRRLTGVRALGSVSERLVHSAPCSVLVAPVA